MRKMLDKRRGLRWNLTTVLEDLDYAYDACTLNKQEKTSRLHGMSLNGLRKTKTMSLNCKTNDWMLFAGNA